jgi:hypothetical protein
MSNHTKVSKMVKFVYWKLGKPTRLASPAAINEAKFAAQEILDAGYSLVQVMEMFTFVMTQKPEINQQTGFDESLVWWKSQLVDLPSLSRILLQPGSKFAIQYEQKAAKMRQWIKDNNYTYQEWIDEMTYPPKDDPAYEDKMFENFLKNPDHFRGEVFHEMKNKLHVARDEVWAALIANREGNSEPILTLARDTSSDVQESIFQSDDPPGYAEGFFTNKIAELEFKMPERFHLPAPQTDIERSLMTLVKYAVALRKLDAGLPLPEALASEGLTDPRWQQSIEQDPEYIKRYVR